MRTVSGSQKLKLKMTSSTLLNPIHLNKSTQTTCTTFIPPIKQPSVTLILDFDQTLGDFELLLDGIIYLVHCLEVNYPSKLEFYPQKLQCIETFIVLVLKSHKNLVRPKIQEFCSTYLKQLKIENKIQNVYICTAGSKLDPNSLVGKFFKEMNSSPQELIFQAISYPFILLDGIYFTNGKKKSIHLFPFVSGQYFIIVDDLPFEENYEQEILLSEKKKQKLPKQQQQDKTETNIRNKKRKRNTRTVNNTKEITFISDLDLVHLQICPYYSFDSFSLGREHSYDSLNIPRLCGYIMDTFKKFTRINLDSNTIKLYGDSLKREIINIQEKQKHNYLCEYQKEEIEEEEEEKEEVKIKWFSIQKLVPNLSIIDLDIQKTVYQIKQYFTINENIILLT